MNFDIPEGLQIENERKRKDKQILRSCQRAKRKWKVMVIPIIAGALGIVSKGLKKRLMKLEIRGRIETIQITALLRLDYVTYWPSTELSIKRCTCVNNRCIRSKTSGYHLDRWTG